MSFQNDPKETNGRPQPVTNDPEEAIDTPKKVEESNDPKIEEDFPGYPHYPAKDDILDPENNNARIDLDVENLTRSHKISVIDIESAGENKDIEPDFTQATEDEGEDIEMVPGTDADVTAEDLAMLGEKDQDIDLGEDEELKLKGWLPVTGKDLDVPDADYNDGGEALGQEDEENSYYSLGGDEMEKLRENDDQNNF